MDSPLAQFQADFAAVLQTIQTGAADAATAEHVAHTVREGPSFINETFTIFLDTLRTMASSVDAQRENSELPTRLANAFTIVQQLQGNLAKLHAQTGALLEQLTGTANVNEMALIMENTLRVQAQLFEETTVAVEEALKTQTWRDYTRNLKRVLKHHRFFQANPGARRFVIIFLRRRWLAEHRNDMLEELGFDPANLEDEEDAGEQEPRSSPVVEEVHAKFFGMKFADEVENDGETTATANLVKEAFEYLAERQESNSAELFANVVVDWVDGDPIRQIAYWLEVDQLKRKVDYMVKKGKAPEKLPNACKDYIAAYKKATNDDDTLDKVTFAFLQKLATLADSKSFDARVVDSIWYIDRIARLVMISDYWHGTPVQTTLEFLYAPQTAFGVSTLSDSPTKVKWREMQNTLAPEQLSLLKDALNNQTISWLNGTAYKTVETHGVKEMKPIPNLAELLRSLTVQATPSRELLDLTAPPLLARFKLDPEVKPENYPPEIIIAALKAANTSVTRPSRPLFNTGMNSWYQYLLYAFDARTIRAVSLGLLADAAVKFAWSSSPTAGVAGTAGVAVLTYGKLLHTLVLGVCVQTSVDVLTRYSGAAWSMISGMDLSEDAGLFRESDRLDKAEMNDFVERSVAMSGGLGVRKLLNFLADGLKRMGRMFGFGDAAIIRWLQKSNPATQVVVARRVKALRPIVFDNFRDAFSSILLRVRGETGSRLMLLALVEQLLARAPALGEWTGIVSPAELAVAGQQVNLDAIVKSSNTSGELIGKLFDAGATMVGQSKILPTLWHMNFDTVLSVGCFGLGVVIMARSESKGGLIFGASVASFAFLDNPTPFLSYAARVVMQHPFIFGVFMVGLGVGAVYARNWWLLKNAEKAEALAREHDAHESMGNVIRKRKVSFTTIMPPVVKKPRAKGRPLYGTMGKETMFIVFAALTIALLYINLATERIASYLPSSGVTSRLTIGASATSSAGKRRK